MLIQVGSKGTIFDTDDLNDEEYYYFCKAKKLGKTAIWKDILTGYLKAAEIESDPQYAMLRD